MNSFTQLETFLIASQESAAALAGAESAKILVYSDSHGGKFCLSRVLSYFGSHMDAIAFCGDGISDLLGIMEEKGDYIPPVVAFVRGNNDPSTYPVNFGSNTDGSCGLRIKIPPCLVFEACGHKIFLAHGHQYGVYSSVEDFEMESRVVGADFAFFGHTHIPQLEKRDCLIMNPGSLCLPRGASEPSFAIITITAAKKSADVTFYKIEKFGGTESYKPYNPMSGFLWG